MRRLGWLHGVAGLCLLGFAGAGTWLISVRALVPAANADCPRGPCFMQGHPHAGWGVSLWLVALVGALVWWQVANYVRDSTAEAA
jgi:hypothetical protein